MTDPRQPLEGQPWWAFKSVRLAWLGAALSSLLIVIEIVRIVVADDDWFSVVIGVLAALSLVTAIASLKRFYRLRGEAADAGR